MGITRYWYAKSLTPMTFVLLPLSFLFRTIIWFRRYLYRIGIFSIHHMNVPVIIVGNIAVGGTGKTPMVIWLAHFLKRTGYRPGIVTRGVGGKTQMPPRLVHADADVAEVGDEAILLVNKSDCPVVIGKNRVAAARKLLANSTCDIIISDDGLQHYALGRDVEIVVVDGMRRFGNQQLLPAGPLRESNARLAEVDFVVINGMNDNDKFTMSLQPGKLIAMVDSAKKYSLHEFPHKKIHAVAAIGNPHRFFSELKQAGFELIEHVFPDHYLYQPQDLPLDDGLPIVMTEKDAVKCLSFANERYWYLPVTANVNERFQQEFAAKLKLKEHYNGTENDLCRVNPVVQSKSSDKPSCQ